MNLPHLLPVRFVTHILEHEGKCAKVACTFPYLPTLPMLVEAAAQASSALFQGESIVMGHVVLMKEIALHVKPQNLDCCVSIKENLRLGNASEFYFEVVENTRNEQKIATGFLTIVLKG